VDVLTRRDSRPWSPTPQAPIVADDDTARPDYDPDTGHEDTPDFLDDDELWFEQKPPKDFDLD